MSTMHDPLTGPYAEEVPLQNAPLVRVLAQVRFPEVLAVERREFVAPFQEAVRTAYPVLRREETHGVLVAPAGVATARAQTAWRFSDMASEWRISLTPTFVALETTKYTSRADFFDRLRKLLDALDAHVQPKVIDRLGVRYVDRISGVELADLTKLVRSEVLGIAGTSLWMRAAHSISETVFDLEQAKILARWGTLPPNATIDPSAIEPASEASWVLDLDMFSAQPGPFDVDAVVEQGRGYAARIYTVFRWAVTRAFLERFGGQP